MPKAGLKGNPPVINIASAPTDEKRQGDFFVNDIKTSIERLNIQVIKASKIGIKVKLKTVIDEKGRAIIEFESATRS